MSMSALRDHLVSAAAGAALLGGGATIIANRVDIAVTNERLDTLEVLNGNVEKLSDDISDLRVEMAKQEMRRVKGQQ